MIEFSKGTKSGTNSHTHFDFDGDGFAEYTEWISDTQGLLVWDRNQNGVMLMNAKILHLRVFFRNASLVINQRFFREALVNSALCLFTNVSPEEKVCSHLPNSKW